MSFYAVTVRKEFEVAQQRYPKYATMEGQRLHAFEPATRA
jgi:hypothetical protein